MTATIYPELTDAGFWQQPLRDRMARFAELREIGPFLHAQAVNPVFGLTENFQVATRYAEVVEISRRPLDFCSGQGAVSVQDMPEAAMEFFGSFINMDDPRHARQRNIVSRSFTPRALQGVLDSVETICAELIDNMCAKAQETGGELDLVEAFSAPFPLLIICDMMGIPRSEFDTVLRATNAILGAGDPEMTGGDMAGMFQSGMELMQLVNELAATRRKDPQDDLTSALVNANAGEDVLAENEIAPFFILLAVAGNDTTRTAISHGMHLLAQHPDQRAIWQDDLAGVTSTAVEEIVRVASPVTFMRRTATKDTTVGDHEFFEGDKVVLLYGVANRDPRVFDNPEVFDVRRDPNPHVGFGGPGPHFCLGAHLARREVGVAFRQLLTRLPDIHITADPTPLEGMGLPLVGGIKRLPVKFTPTAS